LSYLYLIFFIYTFEMTYLLGGGIYARSINIWEIEALYGEVDDGNEAGDDESYASYSFSYSNDMEDNDSPTASPSSTRIIFQGNEADRGSAIALSDISFPGDSQLRNLTFQNNTAAIAATVYWLYDDCENNCSANTMNKEPPGSFSVTMDWKDSNIAPYGEYLGTQPITVYADSSERLITTFGKFIEPPLAVTLYDYYNQEVVSDNTTTVTLSLSSLHCHDEVGAVVGMYKILSI
jgi:hypothetical protein